MMLELTGINLDTSGAAGDADFLAALKATEIKEKFPDLNVEIGMAGEFVLGMHGKSSKYDDVRLAGLYPHKQVKLAEKREHQYSDLL